MTTPNQAFVYIGTVTRQGSEGIYLSVLDLENGHLSEPQLAVKVSNPDFFATGSQNRYLYCTGKGPANSDIPVGAVNGFAIDQSTGELTYLNSQYIEGASYCHISTNHQGTALLAADYSSGDIASFPIDAQGYLAAAVSRIHHQGFTQANPARQNRPHLHSINLDHANQYAFVCDFSADEVTVYRFDAASMELVRVNATKTAPGAGPRHLTLHPTRDLIYVINELNGTIAVYQFDVAAVTLQEIQTVPTLPEDFTAKNTTAEIAISPDERFLYGSNRGHDSLAHYQLDTQSGKLTFSGRTSTGGQHPRNFTIDPTGKFLLTANRDTDNVVVFGLDESTGEPIPTGQQLQISMPMCVKIILR